MKKLATIILLMITQLSMAQFANNGKPMIGNVSVLSDGGKIIVLYDLQGVENESYFIDVEFYKANSEEKLNSNSLSGDVGMVKTGNQKRIYWDYKADSVFFEQKIYARLFMQPSADINLWTHLGKSALFPGWGDRKLRNGIAPYAFGVVGYGSIAAAMVFNNSAKSNYENYLNTDDPDLVDGYFEAAQWNDMASKVFAGVAVTAWIVDIAGILLRYNKIKNHTIELENNHYYDQSENDKVVAQSSSRYINTLDAIEPPYLTIPETKIVFTDANGNNAIDANEKATIEFMVNNIGKGPGKNLNIHVETDKKIDGLEFKNDISGGSIAPGENKHFVIPVKADMSLPTENVVFSVTVKEAREFDPEPFDLQVSLKAFKEPEIIIADHQFSVEDGGRAKKGQIINLQLIIQNVGQGRGEDISASFILPDKVTEISDRVFYIDTLKPNDKRIINFEFIAKQPYNKNTVPVRVKLNEMHGKYAKTDNTLELKLNDMLDKTQLVIEANQDEKQIERASFKSDIDKNIPVSPDKNDNLYVIIIGNEDYHSYQDDLNSENDVEFAVNDARIFYKYAIRTLGAKEKHVELLLNATTGQIKRVLNKYNTLAEFEGEEAEFIFYYAGHGLPDEKTKEPYIIPVDVSGNDLDNAIKLETVYEKLADHHVKKLTVILDACFSGGARNKGLLATRGIKVEPESGTLLGNIVVFSSSSGNESSGAYDDKFHGLFTYYFLKKIKETKGDINYAAMYDHLKNTIKKESVLINNKLQTPNMQFSKKLSNEWKKWTFVK